MNRLREAWLSIRLDRARRLCWLSGHEEPVTMMHEGQLVAVCPRCGKEYE